MGHAVRVREMDPGKLRERHVAPGGDPHDVSEGRLVHPEAEQPQKAALVVGCLRNIPQSSVDSRQVAEHGHPLEAALQVLVDVHRLLEQFPRSDPFVDAGERQDPVSVRLEATLVSEVLQHGAGLFEVSGQLGDPGAPEDGELVEVRVLAAVLAGELVAFRPRLLRPARQEQAKDLFELQVRRGLAPELKGSQHEKLARTPLGLLRELHHGVQADLRRQVRWGLGVDLGPAGDCGRKLSPHVLDSREQIESGEVLGPLVERMRDLDLGVVRFADLDQDSRVSNPAIGGRDLLDAIRLRPGIR